MGDMKKKSWTERQLKKAAQTSLSVRQVLKKLNLKAAGGNYTQIGKYLKFYKIDTRHFKGRGWNRGLKGIGQPRVPLDNILIANSDFQSYKLKNRLFAANLKIPRCEKCGWAEKSLDGRLPLELDHINGNSRDNRIENLRVLCPNCHSLQPTHRGRNSGKYRK